MDDFEKLIQQMAAAKEASRRVHLIANHLAKRLLIPEGDQLVIAVGSGQEKSNVQAVAHWLTSRIDNHFLESADLKGALLDLESDLLRTLSDHFPAY